MSRSAVNSSWGHALDLVEERMVARIPKGQGSVLLDEPEANFSLLWQSRLWELLADPAVSESFQIIVASHSPFALNVPHANYIEFEPDYCADATALLQKHFAKV